MMKKSLTSILVLLLMTLSMNAHAAAPAPLQQADAATDEILAQIATLTANAPTVSDHFRQDDGRWNAESDDEVTRAYQTSTLHIAVASPQTVAWSLSDVSADDFYLEVDAFHAGGSLDNQFGVLLRFVDEQNFYFFAISSDGYYSIQKMVDGEWSNLFDWASSEAITVGEGEGNTLGVLAAGPQISVLVNDQVLATLEDDTFSSGQIALAVGAFDESNVELAFDDLSLWELGAAPDEPSPTPEETPTPTTEATPDPVEGAARLEEIRAEEPLLEDDFRRDNGEWDTGEDGDATYSYAQRTYRIAIHETDLLGWSFNTQLENTQIANFLAEVDISLAAGPQDAEYGLIFHYQDGDNFYIYAISGLGTYSLWKKADGEWSTLIDWTEAAAIDRSEGADNRLALLVEDGLITLLVNDEVLNQVKDEPTFTGTVGVVAGTFDEPDVEVAFDNFVLWALDAAPIDEPTPTAEPATIDVQPRLDEIRVNDPAFSDDFRRDEGDWGTATDENASYAYEGRAFQIGILSDNWIGWSFSTALNEPLPADFLAEVDVEHLAGPVDGEAGLIFRFVDNRNFYVFVIQNQGRYALLKEIDGAWETIIDWTDAEELVGSEGALNRIGVLAEGAQISLLINDVVVAQVEDDAFSAGKIGLVAGTFDEGGLEVAFDNLDVWVLSTGAAATTSAVEAPDAAAVAQQLDEIKSADPAFSDEFRRDSGVWANPAYEGVTFAYERSAYHIAIETPNITPGSTGDITVGNFLLEVDAAQLAGPHGQYGVFFRQVDESNFYLFTVTPFQTYSLWKLVDDEWSAIIDWTQADAILAEEGAVNRLGVLAEGAQITLLVNDVAVAQVEDDTFTEGNVALAAGTFDEGGIEVQFDNLDVWELE